MLGYISEREGNIDEAGRWTSLALEASVPLGKHEYVGYGLLFAADLVQRAGAAESAARLLGASATAFDQAAVVPQARRPRGSSVSALSSPASSARIASARSRPKEPSSTSSPPSTSASLH